MEIAAAAAIGGTALSAFGSARQGNVAAAAGKYNQRAAELEAEGLDIQAEQEVAAASHRTERIKQRSEEILADMRATAAAGGGSSTDATVTAIERETVGRASLDQMLEMANAQETAQQIRHKGEVKRAEGRLARWEGNQKRRAAYINAAATVMKAGASWGDSFG